MLSTLRGVFLDLDTLDCSDIDLDPLREVLDEFVPHGATPVDVIAARLANAEVAITNKMKFNAALLARLDRLKLICLAATGTDNVDCDAAAERGIAVANIKDYCTAAVAQHVFALALALTVHLGEYRALVRSGAWQKSGQFNLLNFPIRELAGMTFGVIGYGKLGRAAARIAAAFDMRVLIAERRGQPPRDGRVPFEEVLAESDVLSLHSPLTPETRGLVGAAEFARMKPDAILINTARGAIVDNDALAAALKEGRLGGAGIDVLPSEPPPLDDPLLALDLPNLIVTPHIAWAAREARQRAIDEIALNIAAFRKGEMRNRVV